MGDSERYPSRRRIALLTSEDLPPELTGRGGEQFSGLSAPGNTIPVSLGDLNGKTLREALEGPERQIILQALRLHNWNRAATADALDINRTTLYKKMKRLGLDDPRLQFA